MINVNTVEPRYFETASAKKFCSKCNILIINTKILIRIQLFKEISNKRLF